MDIVAAPPIGPTQNTAGNQAFNSTAATITGQRYRVIMIGSSSVEKSDGTCLAAEDPNNDAGTNVRKVQIDGVNASSATVTQAQLGNGCTAQVKRAYLYWCGSRDDANTSNYAFWNQTIQIKKPGGSFVDVTASYWGISDGSAGNTDNRTPYYAFAEVTAQLLNAGAGTFTVKDVDFRAVAGGSGGTIGGWNLVLLYEAPDYPLLDFYLWDGMVWGGSGTANISKTQAITVPATGDISSCIGIAALDGDVNDGTSKAETVTFKANNGTLQDLNAVRGVTDFFSSTMTGNGAQFPRVPDCINTFGYDAHHLEMPEGAVPNGATSVTITVNPSTGDKSIYPFMLYLGITKNQADIRATKMASVPTVSMGQEFSYIIVAENIGGRATSAAGSEKVSIVDTLDYNLDFTAVPANITVKINQANGTSSTHTVQAGDISFNATTRELKISNLPQIPKGGSMIITYKVAVKAASATELWRMPCMQDIYNKARLTYYDDGTSPSKKFTAATGQNGCDVGDYTVTPIIADFEALTPASSFEKVVQLTDLPIAAGQLTPYLRNALSAHLGTANGIGDFSFTKQNGAGGSTIGSNVIPGTVANYTNANGFYTATRTVTTHPGKGATACTETYTIQLLHCTTNNLALNADKTDVVCQGTQSGQVIATVPNVIALTNPMIYILATGTHINSSTVNAGNTVENWQGDAASHTWKDLAPGTYTAIAINSNGCERQQTVRIADATALALNLTATNACVGERITFTAAPSGGAAGTQYGVKWYRSADGGTTFEPVESQSDPLTYSVTSRSAAVTMKAVAYSLLAECVDVHCSVEAVKTVTLSQTPNLSISGTTTICSGQNTTLSTTNAGGAVSNWLWKQSADSIAWTNATGTNNAANYATGNLAATRYYRVIGTAAGGCKDSVDVKVTVSPAPTIGNKTATICSGETFTATPANGVGGDVVPAGTTYTWTISNNTNLTGQSAEASAQNAISQTLTNTSTTAQTLTYTVTPTVGTCTGTNFTVTVTVNPKPQIANKTAVVCSGNAFTVTPQHGESGDVVPTGTTYTWTVAANVNVPNASNQASPQSSISQTLTNASSTVQTVVYTVTPRVGTCTGAPFTVTVQVNTPTAAPTQKCGIRVGYTTFASASGKTGNQPYCANDIKFEGTADEAFIVNPACGDPTASSTLNNGNYTIVQNLGGFNGNTKGIVSRTTDGTVVIDPNGNNEVAVYKINGLTAGKTYHIRFIVSNVAIDNTNNWCNQQRMRPQFRVTRANNQTTSGGGLANGTMKTLTQPLPNGQSCTADISTSGQNWDTNNGGNQTLNPNGQRIQMECDVTVGGNGGTQWAGDTGFEIHFTSGDNSGDYIMAIEEIEVTGCVEQKIAVSGGTPSAAACGGQEVCQGTPVTFKAMGLGTTTDTYEWTRGGTVIAGETGFSLRETPPDGVITLYSVRNVSNSANYPEVLTATVSSVSCCGAGAVKFTVPKVCTAPNVNDNSPNDVAWNMAPWQSVNLNVGIGAGDRDCNKIGGTGGLAYLQQPAGRWRCVYDDNNIYFLVEVNDPTPQNTRGSAYYWQDAVEIYLANANGSNQRQYGFGYDTGNGKKYGTNNNSTGRIFQSGSVWYLEISIPMGGSGYNVNDPSLKLEVEINQSRPDEDCRAAQVATWSGDPNHWQSSANYTDVPLSSCASAVADKDTVCAGEIVNISTQMTTAGGGAYTWQQSRTEGSGYAAIQGAAAPSATNRINNVTPTDGTALTSGTIYYRAVQDGVATCPAKVVVKNAITISATTPNRRCGTGSVNLQATASDGGQVKWYANATGGSPLGTSNSGANWATPSISANTTYYVEAAGNTCPGTARVAVLATVNDLPTITVSSETICRGKSTPLTASGASTYSWSPATGLSATTGASVTANPTTTQTYTVTGTDANGCVNTGTGTVTVNALPTPTIGSNSPVCEGGTINLTSGGGTSYAWKGPDGFTSSTQNPTITNATLAKGGSYKVIVTDGNSCVDSTTTTVTVKANPVITPINDYKVCNGAAASVPIAATPGGGTYSWANTNTAIGLGVVGTANPITFTATNSTNDGITGEITVTYTQDGCTSESESFEIEVKPTPTVTKPANQTVCNGANTTAVNFTGNGVSGVSYAWTNSNTAIGLGASGTGDIAAFTATNSGTTAISGTITVTPSANGCTGTAQTFTITVNPSPTAAINNAAGGAICVNSTFTIDATATSGTVAWTHNGTGSFDNAATEDPVYTPGAGDAGNTVALTMTVTGNTTPQCTPAAQATYALAVRALPTASITTGAGSRECVGNAFSLASTTSNGTIKWTSSGSGTFSNDAVANPTYTPSAADGTAGTVTLTLTVTSNTTPACTPAAQAAYTLLVTPIPTATISYTGAPFCQNLTAAQAVTLSGTGAYTGGTYSSTAGLTINATSGAITPSSSTAGTYTVTYTIPASGGCATKTAQTTVTIKPKPTISTAPQSICAGSTLQIAGTPTTGTKSWGNHPTTTGTIDANGLFTAAAVTSVSTTKIAYTLDGCTSDSVVITVDTIPAAPTVGSRIGCPNTSNSTPIAWSSLVTGSTGTLKWYKPIGTAVAAPTTFLENAIFADTYWVSQTTGAGCESAKAEVVVNITNAATNPVVHNYDECALATGGTISWASRVSKSTSDVLNWFTADNADPSSTANATTEPAAFDPKVAGAIQTYYVQIEDVNGCKSNRAAVSVTVKARPTAAINGTAAICSGGSSNAVRVAFVGTAPFRFKYSDGTVTSSEITTSSNPYTIASLAPTTTTTYTLVSLEDAACTSVAADLIGSATITVNNKPVVTTPSLPAAICAGGTLTLQGSVTVDDKGAAISNQGWLLNGTVITSATTISYAQNGQTLKYFATNTCGSDTVTVGTITVNDKPSLSGGSVPAAICAGSALNLSGSTPTVTAKHTGGITKQGWLLDGAVYTSANLAYADNGKQLKYYAINGCDSVTTVIGTITVNDKPTVPAFTAPAKVCEGSTLSLTAPIPVANGSTVTNTGWEIELSAGSWTAFNTSTAMVYATHNGKALRYKATNGCNTSYSTTQTIQIDQAVTATAGTVANIGCICSSATTTATMAATPATVGTGTWTRVSGTGAAGTITNANSPTTTITDLGIGTHIYRWTVVNGLCDASDDVSFEVIADTQAPTFSLSATTANAVSAGSCTFQVPNLSGLISTKNDNCTAAASLVYAQTPAAGTVITANQVVSITLKDACNNTSAAQTVTVNIPAALTVNNVVKTSPQCAGATASATLTMAGGNTPYKYSLDSILGTPATWLALAPISGLDRDTIVYIKDADGCITSENITVTMIEAITATLAKTDVSTPSGTDGTITVSSPAGGNGQPIQYEYRQSNGTTVVKAYSTATSATGLPAGTYKVYARNTGQICEYLLGSVTIDEPGAIVGNATPTDAKCKNATNGTIEFVVTDGATSPYLYQLEKMDGTIVVAYSAATVAKDVPYTFTGLAAGSYRVKVKDQATELVEAYIQQNISVGEPQLLQVSNTVSNPLCSTGTATATLTITGGTAAYEYQLGGTATWTAIVSGGTISSLTADTVVTVRDANQCTANTTITVAIPTAVTFTAAKDNDVSCNGGANGKITVTASGGTGTLQYSKDNGSTWQASNSFTGLTAATYNMLVKDANNCSAAAAQTITIDQPAALQITASMVKNVSCNGGGTDGSAKVASVSGGTAAYSYSWKNASNAEVSTLETPTTLAAGNYTVTVTDSKSCTATSAAVTIITESDTEKPKITGTVPATPAANPTACQFTVPDVTAAVRAISSDNCTTQPNLVITQTPAANTVITSGTTVTVSVKDASGNEETTTVSITIPTMPTLTFNALLPVCENGSPVALTASNSESLAGTFSGTGVSGSSFNPATAGAGTHTLTYTVNASGCEFTATQSIEVYGLPTATVTATPTCPGLPFNFKATGGATYEWTVNGNPESVTGDTYTYTGTTVSGQQITASVYAVSAAAQGSCRSNSPATVKVTVPTVPSVLGNLTHEYCVEQGTVNVTSLISASSGGSLVWYASGTGGATITPSVVNKNVTGVKSFFVAAKSAAGCLSSIEQVDIIINELPTITAVNASNTGSSTVEIAGGAAPYTYTLDGGTGGLTGASLDLGYVPFGKHRLQITDDKGCKAETSLIINEIELIPDKFFTPNNDGENDRWYITNIEYYPESQIYVHDRHGKEIASYTATDFINRGGWDGTYLGKPMPTTDYWYVIQVHETAKRLVGHFLLKR